MKDKIHYMEQRNLNTILDWMYPQDQDDDFLIGKKPHDHQGTWEDEE